MAVNFKSPPAATPEDIPMMSKAAKRQRVAHALDRFLTGQASESDYAVFRDRRLMYCATADQACAFIATAANRSIPFDVYAIWANLLRIRWMQSLSGRRSGALVSQELVEVPAAYPLEDEED
jgi:hypothetical protein